MVSSLLPPSPALRPDRRWTLTSGTPFESLSASIRLMRRQLADRLASEGLSTTDVWALSGIREGLTSPTALGRNLGFTPAGMTQLLDRLESRRLIARRRDRADRRATLLGLTGHGRDVQRRAQVRCAEFLEDLAKELTPGGRTALERLSRELDLALARQTAHPLGRE